MSAVLMLALLLQVFSVALLRMFLGKTWLRRPVSLLVLASVVYDGVSQVLLSFPSVGYWDTYRQGVQQQYVDQATLVMSAGMLALTVCYLMTGAARTVSNPEPDDARLTARVLDWRLLALSCIPLAVLTYEGRGYNGTAVTAPGAAVAPELASGFFVILVVLAASGLILRKGPAWFLPALLAQSLLLAAAGERLPVLADAIALIVVLCRAGMRPSGRQLRAAAGLTLVAILAITGLRAVQGRSVFSSDSGLGTRVSALAGGLSAAGTTPQGNPGLVAQAALRLDGADFAGAIFQAEHLGQPRLSASGVPDSLLLGVPSTLWPSKAASGALNPALAETQDFSLQPVNFLPGLAGLYAGFLPWPGLIAFLAALGFLAGWAERWLLRSCTPARLVLLAGAVMAALDYERGLPGMLTDLRTAAVLGSCAAIVTAPLGRQAMRAAAGCALQSSHQSVRVTDTGVSPR